VGSGIRAETTFDAVVVVPGIMGSELVDADGEVIWGLSPKVLAKAWLTARMNGLLVSEADLEGRPRLRPTRLLRSPAFLPGFHGLEPYSSLLRRLSEEIAIDPRAVSEFAYDWRLSIEHNARLLVTRCSEHLERWRSIVATARYCDPAEVRVALVCHSMGGLVARYAENVLDARSMVSRTITLGTPFFGSVKALQMLASGKGAPVPQRAARGLALTCPGVYDLLPRYRCVVGGPSSGQSSGQDWTTSPAADARLLSVEDVVSLGGRKELANAAAARHARLTASTSAGDAGILYPLVGAQQPTLQSVFIHDGECAFAESLQGVDHGGDGTVYRQAAAPPGSVAFPLPQRHGALAKTAETITFVRDKLIGADTGPPLGTRPVGLRVPADVPAGKPFEVWVSGTNDPAGVAVTSTELDNGGRTNWSAGRRRDSQLLFMAPSLRPGLHRVEVKSGGYSAVSEIMLVWDLP
jgi:hypothetical protein